MSKLSRRELKEDRLRTAFEDYEAFTKEHYREIIAAVVIVLVVVGAVFGIRGYAERIEAQANAQLASALDTYHAYVGSVSPDLATPGMKSFHTQQEKYKSALAKFQAVTEEHGAEALLPRLKAQRIAQYYTGLCQAGLGNDSAATAIFGKSERDSDSSIASLAKLALAGEYMKTGKTADAVKLYQGLADHPTPTVPRSTALLALASLYSGSQPAQARQVYERLVKEYGSDPALASDLSQQMTSLSQ